MEKTTERAPRLDEPEERLEWARICAGFETASDAARRYGWNENTYRSNENGQRGFSKKSAAKYAKAFKVPVEWLLFGQGSMVPPPDPELISLFSNLGPEEQETIRRLMQQMVRRAA
jgi:transcriptional regulator with XRE-family HTH domain